MAIFSPLAAISCSLGNVMYVYQRLFKVGIKELALSFNLHDAIEQQVE